MNIADMRSRSTHYQGCMHICSPGSHKMKASDRSICVVPATAVEILLTLAQYNIISSTPCYVYELQLLFFWLDRTERSTDHGACMCSRASCLGDPYCPEWRCCSPERGDYANAYDAKQLGNPIGVSLATNGLINPWSGLNGSHPCKQFPSYQETAPFLDLRGRGYNKATQSNKDRPGRALLNTYLLRVRSLAQFCPAERSPPNASYYANAYDAKQLGNPIGVPLATNRLTYGFRRYTEKYPRCLSLLPSGSALVQ